MERNQWTTDLHRVRQSKQTRGELTQTKLLDAAQQLISEHGIDDTTVADIAVLAGCSKGAIYHHFKDKKTMTYALIERVTDEFQALTAEATDANRWHGASICDVLRGYVELSFDRTANREYGARAAMQIAQRDPKVLAHFTTIRMEADRALYSLLIERRDEITHEDPELAVKYVLEQISSTLRARFYGDSLVTRFADQPDERFVRETIRSTCGYLGVPFTDGV